MLAALVVLLAMTSFMYELRLVYGEAKRRSQQHRHTEAKLAKEREELAEVELKLRRRQMQKSQGRKLKKREGVPEMGTKPLKALRGYRASNRGSKNLQSRL